MIRYEPASLTCGQDDPEQDTPSEQAQLNAWVDRRGYPVTDVVAVLVEEDVAYLEVYERDDETGAFLQGLDGPATTTIKAGPASDMPGWVTELPDDEDIL